MGQILNGSICLTDIPKEKITKSEKNGKLYLNINVFINDEPDQYNNNGAIAIQQSKDEREAKTKRVYIGNVKFSQQQPAQAAPAAVLNDLPF